MNVFKKRLISLIQVICMLVGIMWGVPFSRGNKVYAALANHVVISQIYAGGGLDVGNPTYNRKFVELYNPTNSSVDLSTWSLQCQENKSINSVKINLTGTIQAHGYYLIVSAIAGSVGQDIPVGEDVLYNFKINTSQQKVILANTQDALTFTDITGSPRSANIIDAVGYGIGKYSYSEGNSAPTQSVTQSLLRKANDGSTPYIGSGNGNGWDTDDNASDFVVCNTPFPRNSSVVEPVPPAAFTVNQPTSADNGVNDDGKSSVTVNWTDSATTTVDHYEIVAKEGLAPEVSDIVPGETSIANRIQTATFDWTAGENLYVGVVAVDINGLRTLCTGTPANVTVAADGHTASNVATVTSGSYTVSAGGTANETITNVPYGTTKSDFVAALTKGESHESFDETGLHDPVVSGDKIVVTAEDGTTKVTYTITVKPAPKSTIATVTSGSYTVSAGGTSNETITNVPYGTTKSDFVAALTKGESHESFDETGLHDPVVSGDKIVVTAEDGTIKVTYTITVNAAPKSTVATVTSGSYTVSAGGTANETITNVPYGTSKIAFQSALTKGNASQTWDVSELSDPVVSGDKIVVTAEDGTTKVTYTITVKPAPKSTIATVTSGSYTVSAGGTSNETITNVPYGTTKSDFVAALTKGESHESFDETGLHDPVVSGDKIVVTAEDGTTKVTYTITVKPAPKSTIATVTSGSYTVSAGGTANETITNVPYGTSKIAFQSELTKGNASQTWDVSELSDPVASGDKIVVTAEDGTTKVTYTITVNAAPKSTIATVTSGSYTVSAGGTSNETITNVPYGTTKSDFVAALTKGESHESFDETGLHDPVVSGDKIVVTAEDGTTKVTYTITVKPAPKSTIATVTSGSYTVSAGGTSNETITNVPYGTTKSDFVAALTKGESHESFDETGLHDPVVSGDKIVVTAEDGTTKVTYTVTVNSPIVPAAFTVNQPTSADNGVNDDGKSSVTVSWTDSGTVTVDHYEIVAKAGSAPGISDTVAGKTSIAKGIQTATFDWTAGENLYVGVVAVDVNGLKTLCSGTTANVTVTADGHTPTPPEIISKGTVIDPETGKEVESIETKVTKEVDGTETVSVKSQEAIVLRTPDGKVNPVINISKLGFSSEGTSI
ncbi:lamin tail domain-containing protein [Clostridium ljungdahlii]|uniref:lamin tail domain-containing protein n=1 Tax=Clostridium ljungdahlii TaxID=1538 RepID=UPI003867AEE0